MMKLLILSLCLFISLTTGQLVIPRTNYYNNVQPDPIVTYQPLPPVTRTVYTVSAVARPQPVAVPIAPPTVDQVTTLRVIPITRPVAPVPQPSPPLYAARDEEVQVGGPYSFKYSADHGEGTTSQREESSDGNGVVRGSYSYVDTDGLYRQVDYIADESGYRATIKTNEPGTERSGNNIVDPAGTTWEISPPPEAVVARYANSLGGRRSTSSRGSSRTTTTTGTRTTSTARRQLVPVTLTTFTDTTDPVLPYNPYGPAPVVPSYRYQ